jgi:DNA-binding CsgD family transcriptional regulator
MRLTFHEKKIIRYLADGLSQKEISSKDNISRTNVNNMIRAAREKNGLRSTIQLVVEAKIKNIV